MSISYNWKSDLDFKPQNEVWIDSGHIFDGPTDYFSFLGLQLGYRTTPVGNVTIHNFDPYSLGVRITEIQADIIMHSFIQGQLLKLDDLSMESYYGC